MEDELKCPVCKQLYNNPVMLPCYHSLCLNCAVHIQQPAAQIEPTSEESLASNTSSSESSSDFPDVDKLSILSETDSGVICNSRPNSYSGTPNTQGILFPPLQNNAISLACAVCNKIVYFDENGSHNLPKNRTMQNIVDKYVESKNLGMKCQLCEGEPNEASVMCEQCEVFYCDSCREGCHPLRGPLAKHNLLPPLVGKAAVNSRSKGSEAKCVDHGEDTISLYCMVCKIPLCSMCTQDGRHLAHDVQAINTTSKTQKWTGASQEDLNCVAALICVLSVNDCFATPKARRRMFPVCEWIKFHILNWFRH
uniref:B box-type domain-containing protein n=1 Tax=Strigamia maritima TaxID=126957 RepID=T1J5V6_STRMM